MSPGTHLSIIAALLDAHHGNVESNAAGTTLEGMLNVSDIARIGQIDRATVSRSIDELVESGMVAPPESISQGRYYRVNIDHPAVSGADELLNGATEYVESQGGLEEFEEGQSNNEEDEEGD